jgi:hypothetical protein
MVTTDAPKISLGLHDIVDTSTVVMPPVARRHRPSGRIERRRRAYSSTRPYSRSGGTRIIILLSGTSDLIA